jgi:hypothetical protein
VCAEGGGGGRASYSGVGHRRSTAEPDLPGQAAAGRERVGGGVRCVCASARPRQRAHSAHVCMCLCSCNWNPYFPLPVAVPFCRCTAVTDGWAVEETWNRARPSSLEGGRKLLNAECSFGGSVPPQVLEETDLESRSWIDWYRTPSPHQPTPMIHPFVASKSIVCRWASNFKLQLIKLSRH